MNVIAIAKVACVGLAAILTGWAGAAGAADAASEELQPVGAPDWIVQVTPYLWASGMKGDISPFSRAPTIHVDESFSDILKDLDFGGFLNVWARRDRFVLSADLMYVDLSDATVIGTLPVIGEIPGGLSASLDSVQFNATLQAGYRVVDTPRFTFDVLGGGRFWYISNDLTVQYADFSRSHGEDFNWIDPLVGARAFYNVTDRLSVMGQADIGGFGVGSDFTWQALGTVNYRFNDNWAVSAGYKVLSVDYDDDGHVFDATLSGPVLGFTYRFN